jgi:hypothetical protein
MEKIKNIIGVDTINSFMDIARINTFVFSIIPVPLYENMRTKLKNLKLQELPNYFALWKSLKPDRNGYYGNWCGFHARLLVMLLQEVYGLKTCNIWGYGLKHIVNHVAVMVVWENVRYTIDPYFGLYYANASLDASPLPFNDLLVLLRTKQFDKIKIVYSDSNLKKNVMRVAGKTSDTHIWDKLNSEEFYNHIVGLFRTHSSERQLRQKFGHCEHMCLMLLT